MPEVESLIFQTLLHSSVPVAIFSWRAEESWPVEFVSPNVHHVLGYTAEDFLSRRVVYADIIHPEDLPRVIAEVTHHSEVGDTVFEHEDYRIVDPSGRVRWVRDDTAVVRDASGRVTHYFGYILESTARHEVLAALNLARHNAEAAARQKSEFLATVSHELRTPLTLILGPVEALLGGEAGPLPERALRSLRRVRRNAGRLGVLVDDLLGLARADAGADAVRWEMVALDALLAALLGEVQEAARSRRIELSLAVSGEPQPIPLDQAKIERVALNLLGNALKFTPTGGRIDVILSYGGSEVELAVADSGPGIAPEEQERIFERFYQSAASPRRRHEGAGLGLALVRSLTTLLGGSVSVASRPGEGSRFSVRLPRRADGAVLSPPGSVPQVLSLQLAALEAPEGPAPAPGPPGPGAPGAAADRPRVVLAEDNEDMRAFMIEVLCRDYDVEAVADGGALLAAVRRCAPEVVICDVMMPEIDGLEAVRTLKGDPSLRAIPVILVTARAGVPAMVEGIEAGADDYLHKPFDSTELRARVRAAARLHRTYLDLSRKQRDLAAAHEALQRAQEQVVQAGKLAALGTFTAGISHELNNPLATILLTTQRLLDGSGTDGPLRERLQVIERQVLRCRGVIRSLLDYARAKPPSLERLPVPPIVEPLCAMARAQARGRGIAVRCELPVDLPCIEACAHDIETALLNVVSNAMDAAPPGGMVTLAARVRAHDGVPGVEFTVSDTGPGIPEDVLPRIFEPFFTTKPVGQGTGLGLALVQRMVENSGGRVAVETGPAGTTLALWLRAAPPPGGDAS